MSISSIKFSINYRPYLLKALYFFRFVEIVITLGKSYLYHNLRKDFVDKRARIS